jgi:hypothetical protein
MNDLVTVAPVIRQSNILILVLEYCPCEALGASVMELLPSLKFNLAALPQMYTLDIAENMQLIAMIFATGDILFGLNASNSTMFSSVLVTRAIISSRYQSSSMKTDGVPYLTIEAYWLNLHDTTGRRSGASTDCNDILMWMREEFTVNFVPSKYQALGMSFLLLS